MRSSLKFLAVASAVVMPAAAQAQGCTALQLAANPLVGMGYQAFVRINNTAFDLSCYYQTIGAGQVSFGTFSPTVSLGAGTSQIKATVAQAAFDMSIPLSPEFNYGVQSNLQTAATTPADFVFAFSSPLTNAFYTSDSAQVGVTRASGNPNVTIVPAGSQSTMPLAGFPSYLVAQSTFLQVAGGGSISNPNAVNLGVGVGATPCVSGTACSYAPAGNTPNQQLQAWTTIISYRQARPVVASRPSNAQVNGQVDLVASVPEPATVTLMATGLMSLLGIGYSRRRNNA